METSMTFMERLSFVFSNFFDKLLIVFVCSVVVAIFGIIILCRYRYYDQDPDNMNFSKLGHRVEYSRNRLKTYEKYKLIDGIFFPFPIIISCLLCCYIKDICSLLAETNINAFALCFIVIAISHFWVIPLWRINKNWSLTKIILFSYLSLFGSLCLWGAILLYCGATV